MLTVPFRQEDAGPAHVISFSCCLTGKINVNNFRATVGVSVGHGGNLALASMPFCSLADRKFA